MQLQIKSQCEIRATEIDQKLRKTFRQRLKNRTNLYEPFQSF